MPYYKIVERGCSHDMPKPEVTLEQYAYGTVWKCGKCGVCFKLVYDGKENAPYWAIMYNCDGRQQMVVPTDNC